MTEAIPHYDFSIFHFTFPSCAAGVDHTANRGDELPSLTLRAR